jgi:hypothetical protein
MNSRNDKPATRKIPPGKFLLLVFFCFSVSACFSKDILPDKEEFLQDLHVGLIVRNHFLSENTFKTTGLRAAFPVNEHWSLNYNYSFIQTSSGVHLSHIPFASMLLRLLPYMAHGSTRGGKGLLTLTIIAVTIPEGVSYTINPGDRIQFIPYLNPFGFDRMIGEREGQTVKTAWTYAMNGGLEIQSKFGKRYYAGSDAGFTWTPDGGKVAIGVGICLGMKLAL